ncbi:MAG TPA: hypothetical protein PK177_03340 [Burkholderiaceae bacterium]|nr:hypothetical protein [Burkholderiaceae bacterium]
MKSERDHHFARAIRRDQLARIKQKRIREREARNARLGLPPFGTAERKRRAGVLANTATPCSCWLCGNPRRLFGEPTPQEKRWPRDEDDPAEKP